VKWSPEAWTESSERSKKQRTPDISQIIQAVVSQSDWKSGNALVIVINGSGQRPAVAYDGKPAAAPMLHIEYGR
jgi:hypothetical protein